jgi:hypothetical protein
LVCPRRELTFFVWDERILLTISLFFEGLGAVRKIFTLGLSIGVLWTAGLTARAHIIPSFVGATPSGGNTVWTYSIDITSLQNVTAGDFFTIYDFGPFLAGTGNQPSGWTLSSSLLGVNPSQLIISGDDPTLLNLTWTYNGPTIPSNTTLAPFEVTIAGVTPFPVPVRNSFFAAEATAAGVHPDKQDNIGQISVPVIVPEASTFSLLVGASGLMGVCWIVSRLRKRQLRA